MSSQPCDLDLSGRASAHSTPAAACCKLITSLKLWRLRAFPDFCEPCLPGPVEQPPAGSDWIHEIKHDGFRLLARRGTSAVRLFTRNGHDWTARFPLIAAAVDLLRVKLVLDRWRGGSLRRRRAAGVRSPAIPPPGRAGVSVCVRPA